MRSKPACWLLTGLIALYSIVGCTSEAVSREESPGHSQEEISASDEAKVAVLNIGTFHMDYTPDPHKVDFDEHNEENLRQVKALAEKIAAFNPTVICVEMPPERNEELRTEYQNYLQGSDSESHYFGEIGLLAFEVGKRCGTERIYGIDNKVYYNFMIGQQLQSTYPSEIWADFVAVADTGFSRSERYKNMDLLDKIRYMNGREYYDFLFNINADILTHVSSDTAFEGADEAAKFYQRNLRMYANLNKIDLKAEDRVFILMGAAHTAYFDMFFSRSPRYRSVDVLDYL